MTSDHLWRNLDMANNPTFSISGLDKVKVKLCILEDNSEQQQHSRAS